MCVLNLSLSPKPSYDYQKAYALGIVKLKGFVYSVDSSCIKRIDPIESNAI